MPDRELVSNLPFPLHAPRFRRCAAGDLIMFGHRSAAGAVLRFGFASAICESA
jgi:hypothetical protein